MKCIKTKLTAVYVYTVSFTAILFTLVFAIFPRSRKQFIKENRFLEDATAYLFLLAFLVGIYMILKMRKSHFLKSYFIFPFLGLLGYLDEISFGKKFFDIEQFPEISGVEFDGAHDIFALIYASVFKSGSYLPLIFICIFSLILIIGILKKIGNPILLFKKLFFKHPPFKFFIIFTLLLSVAVILDLHILGKNDYLSYVEELTEFNTALALLFGSIAIAQNAGCCSSEENLNEKGN